MNQVDTRNGRRDVTIAGWDRVRPTGYRLAAELVPGDVIAIPFAGYGDILCEITAIEPFDADCFELTASDGGFSYTHIVLANATIPVYPAGSKGAVHS